MNRSLYILYGITVLIVFISGISEGAEPRFQGILGAALAAQMESIEAPQAKGARVIPKDVNAGCFILHRERLLVIRRRANRFPQFDGRIDVPGGKPNDGETALETAARETLEETGLKVKVGKLLHHFKNKNNPKKDFYLYACELSEKDAKRDSFPLPDTPLARKEVHEIFTLDPGALKHPKNEAELRWRYEHEEADLKRLFTELTSKKQQ